MLDEEILGFFWVSFVCVFDETDTDLHPMSDGFRLKSTSVLSEIDGLLRATSLSVFTSSILYCIFMSVLALTRPISLSVVSALAKLSNDSAVGNLLFPKIGGRHRDEKTDSLST